MTIICGECGARNDDDSDFCASCGEPLEWTAVRPQEETAAPAAAAATAVVEAPPAPAAEAPPAPPAAPAEPEVTAPPPEPEKRGFGRKAKTPPPPPPAATPPPVLPPTASAPPVEAPPPVEEPPAAPVEASPEPPSAAAPPDVPAAPPPRVPPPRRPVAAEPEDEEAEAARREAEEQARREELARKLVVPVEREPEPVPVPEVVPVVAPPPEEKLTWWQRLVRWFKRVILRQKPAAATAAVAAPVAAQQAPTAPPPADEAEVVVASRAPGMQKPGEEYVRREKTRVDEEHPEIKPGDLICTQCGTGNVPTNRFCKRCGHSLAEAPVAQKPSWWKRFLGFFAFRKKRQYAAGERKKKQQQAGGKRGGIFWRLQGLSFKTVAIVMLGVAALGAYAAFGGTLQDRFTNRYRQVMRLVHPSYTAVRTGQMKAVSSSVKGPAVGPRRAIDNKCNTVWITKPNAKGGVGSALTITFNTPIRLGVVVLRNGDLRSAKDCEDLSDVPAGYDGQSRVKQAKVLFFNKRGSTQVADPHVCKFKDNGGKSQNCKFGSQGVADVGKLRMLVTVVYPGTKGKSVAVTEFEPQTVK